MGGTGDYSPESPGTSIHAMAIAKNPPSFPCADLNAVHVSDFMKFMPPSLLCVTLAAMPLHAESDNPGRAVVEWLAKTEGYTPGEPVITAFKMTLDDGWHTYWINPGEAGMPKSARFELPDGWTADPIQFPVPIRFTTGDLHDFGYEGTVLFPIVLHPPTDATGDVEITGAFDWLACDDSACIPGDASLTLHLTANNTTKTDSHDAIAEALKTIPVPAQEGWNLDVEAHEDTLKLTLTAPQGINPAELEFYPLTVNIAHPAAPYDWTSESGQWIAEVRKSPFAPDPLESFELVAHSPEMPVPLIISWNAEK